MSPPRIALLGAPGTGRSRLAAELQAALHRHGLRVVVDGSSPPPDDADLVLADSIPLAGLPATPPFQAILLMGLDLPGPAERQADDARLRAALARAGLAFQVVYGTGEARLAHALAALQGAGVLPPGLVLPPPAPREGVWRCEKCSDPECEHRLFRRLLAGRE